MLKAIHRVFNNQKARRLLVKLRVPLGLVVFGLLATQMKPEWYYRGLAICLVGAFLQCWCFACLKKQRVLAVNGPYGFVRNPMYLARFLLLLGGVIMTANVWLTAGFTVLYYFYMVNRVAREEATLTGIFGDEYAAYCRDVPRFLPRLRQHPAGRLRYWSWELFHRNNGGRNAGGVVLILAACWWYVFRLRS